MSNGYWMREASKILPVAGILLLSAWMGLYCGIPDEGKTLFETHCVNCHMADGSGLRGIIPAINQSPVIYGQFTEMACLLYQGRQPADTTQSFVAMPSFKSLSNAQIANVINYVKKRWTDNPQFVSEQQVAEAVKACQ